MAFGLCLNLLFSMGIYAYYLTILINHEKKEEKQKLRQLKL